MNLIKIQRHHHPILIVRKSISSGISSLGLSACAFNPIDQAGINTIGELRSMSPSDLAAIRWLGKTSVDEIYSRLTETAFSNTINSVESKPQQVKPPFLDIDPDSPVNILSLIVPLSESILAKIGETRAFEVIERRYGLADNVTYTLQEIGDYYGVTRERIRQIESKTIRKVSDLVGGRSANKSGRVPTEIISEYNDILEFCGSRHKARVVII